MAFKLAEAYVEFTRRGVAGLAGDVSKTSRALEGMQRAGRLASAAIISLGTGEAAAALKFAFNAAADAERQTAKLEAVLRATKGASDQTVESLERHASALQDVTAFEDDTVKAAQAVLLTFNRISGDTFPRATEAALDIATVFETDLSSAAMMVGKALQDPEKGLLALSRAGVSFSKEQKQVIKDLVETGKAAEAQAAILSEIEGQVGGSARRVGETAAGSVAQLRNQFGDLAEEIGTALLPVVKAVTGSMREFNRMIGGRAAEVKDLGEQAKALSKQLLEAKTREAAVATQRKIADLNRTAAQLGNPGATAVAFGFSRSYAMQSRIAGLPSASQMVGGVPLPRSMLAGADAMRSAFANSPTLRNLEQAFGKAVGKADEQVTLLREIRDRITSGATFQ